MDGPNFTHDWFGVLLDSFGLGHSTTDRLKSIDLSLLEGDMDLCSCARECELM